jgi:protein-disulfide isomerase
VRFVVKFYPYKYRDYAYGAATLAVAAWRRGKFAEAHDIMLARSPRLERENLVLYAREIGLDPVEIGREIDVRAHDALIQRDLKLAHDLDLYNTPAFFFNGRAVFGNRPYEYYKRVMDEELARVGVR